MPSEQRRPALIRKCSTTAEAMAHIELLNQATLNPTIWERPISLLIQHKPTWIGALSDAAYTGIGGWLPDLKCWIITCEDLVKCWFNTMRKN